MNDLDQQFDVAIIGGGPAGMMAAIRAAELGAKVALIEKNHSLGKKLLITGKGRCNITQAEFSVKEFIAKLGKSGRFLFSSLSNFGPQEVINFFESRNLPTKTERGGRVFPVSDNSQDVLSTLEKELKNRKVTFLYGREVLGLEMEEGKIKSVDTKHKKITAKNFILATGGKSYPATGSTGDGYSWAKSLGHTITPTRPALVPVRIKEDWVEKLAGLSLKNVQLNIFQNGKKEDERFGEMLFTHTGVSGPIVLDISKRIGELLSKGEVILQLDFKPALSWPQLDQRLQRDFSANINKDFKNYLPDLIPQKLIEVIINLSGIDGKRKINSISKEERKTLIHILKEMNLTVLELLGYYQAIVTTGGVSTREIDSKTMRSKIVPNLFFAGEIIDIDGPTGGYNLQISWSTGYTAGENAAKG